MKKHSWLFLGMFFYILCAKAISENKGNQMNKPEIDEYDFFLNYFRKRPSMYIYPVNLTNLDHFLAGYCFALHNYQLPREGLFSEILTFDDWVAVRENGRIDTRGWSSILTENSSSDEEALEKFFQYLEEHKNKDAKVIYEYILTPEDKNRPSDGYQRAMYSKEMVALCDLRPDKIQVVTYDECKQGVFFRKLDFDDRVIGRESYCFGGMDSPRVLELINAYKKTD